jgi:hypothetical protein
VTEENEIVTAARDAKARKDAAKGKDGEARAKRWHIGQLGLGAAIGSAAVAAAVLFSNRDKGN